MTARTNHTLKTVGDCEIRVDVYQGEGPGARPAIVWLHGGALMFGNRGMIHPAQVERYVKAGYTVIAPDYRLAPETKLPEIFRDVQDAVAWARSEGARSCNVDPTRLAIVGHSAGGYLALLAGGSVRPRPQALVAFYGYGDIVGPWYSTPSAFYCQQPRVSEREAEATVGTTAISESPRQDSADFDPARDRGRFYLYCRQHGCWPQAATGLDPRDDDEAWAPFCPVRRIAPDHPPTMLLHGDEDTDVPYDQSVMMARAFADAAVAHHLLTIPGGAHGFDAWMDDPVVAGAFADVLGFLAQHMGMSERLNEAMNDGGRPRNRRLQGT
jgi:acetyl esterase/lipase